MERQKYEFHGDKVSFSVDSDGKRNWMPFKGTCLYADSPSDGVPCGVGDKPVLFPHDELKKGMDTMVNMGVDCKWPDGWCDDASSAFTNHDDRFKIGTVTEVELVGNEMVIAGGLWDYDFYDVCEMYTNAKKSLGFSVEVYFSLEDSGEYYTAHDIEFTGVAILFADLAAFKKTYIAAKAKSNNNDNDDKQGGIVTMDKDEFKEMLSAFAATITKQNNDAIEGMKAEFSAQISATDEKVAGIVADIAAKKAQDEKAAAELAEKAKLEQEKKAEEEKLAAELAEKKKKEEEAAKERKSSAFGGIINRFADKDNAAKINADATLTPSQKFQALLADSMTKSAE